MSYDSEILVDSPALFLKLDEASGTTAADASGNSRDFTGGNLSWGQGSLLADGTGSSATFNGTTSYLTKASAAWMKSASFTVTMRYKHVTSAGFRMFNGRWQQSGMYVWLLTVNNNKVELYLNNALVVTGATTLANGTVYTIGARCNGSTAQVFVNGASDGSVASAGAPATLDSRFDIGDASGGASQPPAAGGYTPGQISRYAFWASAVSDTRLAAQHSAAIAGPSGAGSLSLSASGGAAASPTASGVLNLAASGAAPAAESAGLGSLTLSATGDTVAPEPAGGAGSLSLSASGGIGAGTAGTASLDLIGTGTALAVLAAAGTGSLNLTASGSAVMSSGGAGFLTLSAVGEAIALYLTDTTNGFRGRTRYGYGTVTMTGPTAPIPPGRTYGQRVDKAIAYPAPDMVDGRPT